jgi:hypothetical protein
LRWCCRPRASSRCRYPGRRVLTGGGCDRFTPLRRSRAPAASAAQFEALGAAISIRTSTLVGGIDIMAQAISLAKRPHVIVGTPGRVTDHLTNTKARHSERPGGVHTGCLLGA